MAELSQEQLLLLDNLMYFNAPSNLKSAEAIAKYIKHNNIDSNLTGGMDSAKMNAIADAVLKDPALRNLKVAGSLNEHNVSAKCFVDPKTQEATIAIRGTGGSYEAWKDNVMGGYETDTTCQKTLDRFVKEMGDNYNDITITGHSKGGNLAQYATIKNGDKIDRCVSFDGQGFNKDFIAENKALIEANKDKITSINAYNDYVNILLTPIAGEIVYLNCNEDIPDSHSSYALWEANKGLTDENGDFNRHVKQSEDIVKLKEGLDDLIDSIGDLPDYMQKEIFSLLGTIAGLIFDHDLTDKEILRDVWKTLMQFEKTFHFRYPADFLTIMNLIKLMRELSKGDKKSSQSNRKKVARTAGNAARTTIKCKLSGFSRASEEMSSMSSRLINIASEIKANSANDDIQIARSINRCLDALNDYNHTIKNFSASLQSIKHLYDECESSIASEAFAAD